MPALVSSAGRAWWEWHQLPKDAAGHKWVIALGLEQFLLQNFRGTSYDSVDIKKRLAFLVVYRSRRVGMKLASYKDLRLPPRRYSPGSISRLLRKSFFSRAEETRTPICAICKARGGELGTQISKRIETTVTVNEERVDTATEEFRNDRSGSYRRVACWYV